MKILENLKVVFIVGCQRTGTTLAGNILAAHPNAFMIDETDSVYLWTESIFTNQDEQVVMLKYKEACQKARLKYVKPNSKCLESGELSSSITHLVLKVPNLTFNAEQIIQYFANPYCIFTYRDLRDVVVSMGRLHWITMVENQLKYIQSNPLILERFIEDVSILKSGKLKPHQARAYVAKIKISLRVDFNREELNPIEVRYEDLTQNPDLWTKKMLQHIGLTYDLIDLDHTKKLVGWGPGLTYRKNKINTYSIGQWKEFLSVGEEKEIWKIIEPLMLELGYQRHIDKIESNSNWKRVRLDHKYSPVVATGRGGSGTRLLSNLLQSMNVFLGNKLGKMGDSLEWVNILARIAAERSRNEAYKAKSCYRTSFYENTATILNVANLDRNTKWGWKLPETMLAVPEVFDAFPKARLIHLVRHPINSSIRRTHVTSRNDNLVGKSVLTAAYKSLNWQIARINSDPDYLKNAATWLYQVSEVVRYAKYNLNSSSYMEIKFEDLCAYPTKTFLKIANFLNINIDGIKQNIEIDSTRLNSWKYPDKRADEVWEICSDLAENLGYQKIN